MDIKQSFASDILIIELIGDLVTESAAFLKERLLALINSQLHGHVVFDLSHVSIIDSKCLAILILCYRDLKTRGYKMAVVGLSDEVQELFTYSKLGTFFVSCKTKEEAILLLSNS